MKKILATLAILTTLAAVTGCVPSQKEIQDRKIQDIERHAERAAACQDKGGRYVLTIPPGYVSASYWCLFDEEREGGEW